MTNNNVSVGSNMRPEREKRHDRSRGSAGDGPSSTRGLGDSSDQGPARKHSTPKRRQSISHDSDPSSSSRPKRQQIATACTSCRDSKLKCSGNRPTCTRCSARALACSYDVGEEGMTRREHLRRQYEEQKGELDRAHAVLGYLQGGSDSEAAECLARLRIGCTVDQVYHMLGSRSPGLDGRQMSPEAAHVAAQLSSSHLSTALTGGPSTISTDGGDFDGAALPVGAGPPRDTTGPSMYASPRSWDEALLTSASTEYPTSPWSDILDLALQQ